VFLVFRGTGVAPDPMIASQADLATGVTSERSWQTQRI
jgi:hypothetical protein